MSFDHEAYEELFHKDDQASVSIPAVDQKKSAQETDSAVETGKDTAVEYTGAGDPPDEADQDDAGGDE